jgi:uncharacterized membrane protein YphA (DoxX/SURF4 family)
MAQSDRARLTAVRLWLGTLARLVLAAVFFIAGTTKIGDLAASGRAVNAYQLMPYDAAKIVGAALPFMEIVLALFLLAGLATRAIGAITGVLLAVYIAGIASVWARGLSIDCGCFGNDGQLADGAHPNYLGDIVRDVLLLAVAGFLAWSARTRLSLDTLLLGEPDPALLGEPEDDHEPEDERESEEDTQIPKGPQILKDTRMRSRS